MSYEEEIDNLTANEALMMSWIVHHLKIVCKNLFKNPEKGKEIFFYLLEKGYLPCAEEFRKYLAHIESMNEQESFLFMDLLCEGKTEFVTTLSFFQKQDEYLEILQHQKDFKSSEKLRKSEA